MSPHMKKVAAGMLAVLFAACSSNTPKATPSTETPTSSASPSATESAASAGDWPAYHHDAARSGASSDQAKLGKVHKAWSSPALDGAVYAQPLVVGSRVYVATEANSVYALSASSGKVVWRRNVGTPVSGGSLPCGNISPSGITSTPVIDGAASRIYALAFQRSGPHHELYALDLASGAISWHRAVDPPGLSPTVEQAR